MDRQKDSNSITLIHLRLQAHVRLTVTITSSFLHTKYGITDFDIDDGLSQSYTESHLELQDLKVNDQGNDYRVMTKLSPRINGPVSQCHKY